MKTVFAGLFGALWLIAAPASAQTRLFSDNSEIQLLIEAPLTPLLREAARNTEPRPAFVTLLGQASSPRWDVQVAPGGIFRRTANICRFPPLRLNFQPEQVRGTLFQGQNKLKLVTRCLNNGEHLVVLEYTAYRLFNEITPLSFRARPARVTYRDNAGRRREETQFNFLIEDTDDMARRNHLAEIDVRPDEVNQSQLDPAGATRYAIFQFMISNLDWDMVSDHAGDDCCHNSKLLAAAAASRANVIPIPYDFDFSGFVNASYATPPEGLSVNNVRTRYYRGYCRFNDAVPAVLNQFRARREAMLAIINGETRMPEPRRRAAAAYIEDFFALINDPARVSRQITEHCRH